MGLGQAIRIKLSVKGRRPRTLGSQMSPQACRTVRYLTVLVCFGFYCFLVGCAINYPQCELEIVKAELKIIIIMRPSHQRIAKK